MSKARKGNQHGTSQEKIIVKVFDPKTGFTVPVFSEGEKMIFDIEEFKKPEMEHERTEASGLSTSASLDIAANLGEEPRQVERTSGSGHSSLSRNSAAAETAVCIGLDVHQPFRLRPYNFTEIGNDHFYEQHEQNLAILHRICNNCYLPANEILLKLIKKNEGRFRISFSISGTAIEQLLLQRPDVIESFQSLVSTGCVELLGETYYHSFSFLYSEDEFRRQIEKHRKLLNDVFGVDPTIFRNTELIYRNDLAKTVAALGFKGMIVEGADSYLNKRSPNFIYQPNEQENFSLLLRNSSLSDDIAFHFNDPDWNFFPLTAQKFSAWIHDHKHNAGVINLSMNYEIFGEHLSGDTGIFEFLESMPEEILKDENFCFKTPSEIASTDAERKIYDVPDYVSWNDQQKDLSLWTENEMQQQALQKIYSLEKKVMATRNDDLLSVWGKLQTSDHYYYMTTKFWATGEVNRYFSPFQSPYDACLYYMNVLSDLEISIDNTLQSTGN